MTKEEQEAWLDHLAEQDEPFDPEEYLDPEGPPPPGEDELTPEELAGIREVTEAEARSAADAERLGATGALAAIAAIDGRRGPGQPGSARVFPGESSSRAAAFGSGLIRRRPEPGCAPQGGARTPAACEEFTRMSWPRCWPSPGAATCWAMTAPTSR